MRVESHKTRILFLIGNYGTGGKERQLTEIIKHLSSEKYAIHLFSKCNSSYYFNSIKKFLVSYCSLNKKYFNFNDIFELIEKQNIFKSKFDLIFCDPPFKDTNIEKLIELIFYKNLLNKNGVIILHRSKSTKEKLPNYFEIVDERTYGISKIIFGKFLS